jgi:hypothetical protein
MACTSGSVQTVADRTVAAKAQIDRLQAMIEAQEGANKAKFFAEIASHLRDANVKDAREISYNSDVKTEYTSEFSLDKIAAVVTSALTALAKAQDPAVKAPAMSPDAIAAYADVVNTVAEAAKSSSTASASLAFSMNRLSPGLFAFLYASSVNIKDEDTFGSEAVTTTAIYYRFMQSIDDVKNEARFGAAVIDARSLLAMKTLQAALVEQLAAGTIDIDGWTKKDAAYSAALNTIEGRLAAARFDTAAAAPFRVTAALGAPVATPPGSAVNQQVVRAAIHRLSAKGDAYKAVIETSNARLATGYY